MWYNPHGGDSMEYAIIYFVLAVIVYYVVWRLRRLMVRFISQEIKDIISHYMSYK